MITPEHMISEYTKYRGQFVIVKHPIRLNEYTIQRFMGIVESHIDAYYLLFDGFDIHLLTGVETLIPLKGRIDELHYNRLLRNARLNHLDYIYEPDEFQEMMEIQLREYKSRGYNLITELVWTVN